MKKFIISYSVTGYVDIEVEAETEAEARAMADDKFSEADCGDLYNIDGLGVEIEED